MASIGNILANKGTVVFSVHPENTILEALQLMKEKNIGAVLVMEGERVSGIFSERDFARQSLHQENPFTSKVKEFMTTTVFYINLEEDLRTCLTHMTDKHIRHLPVVKNGKVVGVISIGDVVKAIIEEQGAMITGLENFIIGQENPH